MSGRYRVEFTTHAARVLRKLDRPVAARISKALATLEDNPRPVGVKAIVGAPGALRIRVGDYRIVYEIHDDRLVVLVLDMGHRSSIYRGD